MESIHLDRANALIELALSGELSLRALESELLSLIVDLDPVADRVAEAHIGDALLVLAEMDRGHRTEENVRAALATLVAETASRRYDAAARRLR